MSTEYHQLPSQQGKMPLDYIVDNDPWLISATSNLSLDSVTWGPATKSPVLSQAPSPKVPKSPLYEHVGHDSDGWLKSSVTLDSPMKVKSPVVVAHPTNIPKEFFSTASKIDAWTVQTIPSVDSKKKAQLKQQQQQQQQLQLQQAAAVAAQVLSPLLSASMQLQEDEDIKAIEDELAIQNRYKTELCKSFTETGVCRYGSKCQFAHGKEEVRPILRHPKYKTETCKTFHSTGTCPYGIRCRFIHTRAKEESIVYAEEDSLRASGKVAPPPGIPVPQWSKSWSPNASIGSPQLQTKKSSGKKHGLGKIQLVESAPDY